MKLYREFKNFAVKGNMLDMAVGIILGASFNKLINVLVKEVMMPPLSLLSGSMHFEDQRIVLKDPVLDPDGVVVTEEVAIGYGALLEAFIDFFVIGFTVFVVVKFMNKIIKRAEDTEDKTVETPKNIELMTKMTHLLEEQNQMLGAKVSNEKS
jgi:large conductance mechanosensitive channel